MIVTDTITKMLADYKRNDMSVNSSIKYRFIYNGCETDVYYTTQNGLEHQLLLSIKVDSIDYLTTVYFRKNETGNYSICTYLPPELYKKVKFKLLLVNGRCETIPYFESMCYAIKNTEPVASNHVADIGKKNLYRYGSDSDNPYFETIIRKKMSSDMKDKIFQKYGSAIAKEILQFCGNTKTLRFTSDITKSKDILAFLGAVLPRK